MVLTDHLVRNPLFRTEPSDGKRKVVPLIMSSTHQNPKTLAIHKVDVFGMCCHLRSCCYYNTTGSGLWEFNQINGDAVLQRWPRDTCPEQGVTWSLAEELCSLVREAERSRELCTLFAAFQDLFVMQKEGFCIKAEVAATERYRLHLSEGTWVLSAWSLLTASPDTWNDKNWE